MDVDFGDDAPIVGGAAGDGRDATPPPDSAAARASATTLTRTAPLRVQPVAPAPVARFRGLRLALGVVAVLAVLAGGGVLARMWVLQQYYVGANDEHVAIFQGVRGSVLGLPLQHLVEQTDIALTDLPEATRNTVRGRHPRHRGRPGRRPGQGGAAARQHARALPRAGAGGAVRGADPADAGAAARPVGPRGGPRRSGPGRPRRPEPGRPRPSVDTTPLPTVAPEPGLNCRPVS